MLIIYERKELYYVGNVFRTKIIDQFINSFSFKLEYQY